MRKPVILLLLISALTLALAYQFRAPLALEMASPAEEIYLTRGFYPNEETAGVTFRWTSGDAQVTLPGVGGGVPLKLHLQLQEYRPAPLSPNPVTITLNGQQVASFTPATDLAAYDFDLPPADLRGDAHAGAGRSHRAAASHQERNAAAAGNVPDRDRAV